MSRPAAGALPALAALLLPASLAAQQINDGGVRELVAVPHAEAPEARAIRTLIGIRVDGRLDEAAWAEATPVTEFTQMDPDEGHPVSERTEVRFVYDDDALLCGRPAAGLRPGHDPARPPRRQGGPTRISSR